MPVTRGKPGARAGTRRRTAGHIGRPTKSTPTAQERVLAAIRMGATYELAARAGGISHDTLTRWRQHAHDDSTDGAAPEACEACVFCVAFTRVEAEAAEQALDAINRAMLDDWRAAAWFLERRYPQEWGKGGGDAAQGGSVQINVRYVNDWRGLGVPQQANVHHGPANIIRVPIEIPVAELEPEPSYELATDGQE